MRGFKSRIPHHFAMNEKSKAFKDYKGRVEQLFNFAAVITAGIPALKHQISLFNKNTIHSIPKPDFFEASVNYKIDDFVLKKLEEKGLEQEFIVRLEVLKGKNLNYQDHQNSIVNIIGLDKYKEYYDVFRHQSSEYVGNLLNSTNGYQSKLASYLYLSSFSFFEGYIFDLTVEVFSVNKFSLDPYEVHKAKLDLIDKNTDAKSYKKKLSGSFDKNRIDRYKKYSNLLDSKGYIKPKEILEVSFFKLVLEKLNSLDANGIPDFLEKIFHFTMEEDIKKEFHSIRNNRNNIAHGDKNFSPDLSMVMKVNNTLKELSKKIDSYVVGNLFPISNYYEESQ